MHISKLLAGNVKRLRQARGWSQEDLAEAADLHRTYVSGIERGVRNPTISVVSAIARGLGVSPDELLRVDQE